MGKKFVFDHHDLSPELFLARYNRTGGMIYKILLLEEKLCLRSANLIIATNESYKAIDILRGKKKPEQIFIVRNGPDLEKFRQLNPDENLLKIKKTILLYIGVIGPQDGIDYLLLSLKNLVYTYNRTDFYCIVIGKGDALDDLKQMALDLKLKNYVKFTGFLCFEDLLRYLSTADICLDPNPSNPLNDVSTWIKVMEYMALGKPVVSFDLKETKFTAQDAAVYVKPNDVEEYAKAIIRLMDDPVEREWRGQYGKKRIEEELAWKYVSKNLLKAYEALSTN